MTEVAYIWLSNGAIFNNLEITIYTQKGTTLSDVK